MVVRLEIEKSGHGREAGRVGYRDSLSGFALGKMEPLCLWMLGRMGGANICRQ